MENSCFLNGPLRQLVPGNHDINEPKKFVKKRQVCDLVFFNEFKTTCSTHQSTKLCLKISKIKQKQKIKQFQSNFLSFVFIYWQFFSISFESVNIFITYYFFSSESDPLNFLFISFTRSRLGRLD